MIGKLLIVAGISGVGKTHTISHFIKDNPTFVQVRASALLEGSDRALPTRPEFQRTGHEYRQAYLARELEKFRNANMSRNVLVDAHAVIDIDRAYFPVGIEVFKGMIPDGFILIEDDVLSIHDRRSRDALRSRPHRTVEDLIEYQDFSRSILQSYGRDLSIPVKKIKSGDISSFASAVFDLIATP